jgi:putative flippase GtrA
LGFGDGLANIIGYICGLAISFTLNRTWTFRHSGALATALARFLLVFLIAYLFNLVTVLLAIHALRLNPYLAHAIGVVPYTLVLFLGSQYFAFRAQSAGRS